MEDPIAMHHWRGPRAFGNRYEGWEPDRAPMVNKEVYFDNKRKKKKNLKFVEREQRLQMR